MMFKEPSRSVGDQPILGRWIRAARCSNGGCVEVQFTSGMVRIRDSKEIHTAGSEAQPNIEVDVEAWSYFLEEVRGSTSFGKNDQLALDFSREGYVTFRSVSEGTTLLYDTTEWDAFVHGVLAGEFDLDVAMV